MIMGVLMLVSLLILAYFIVIKPFDNFLHKNYFPEIESFAGNCLKDSAESAVFKLGRYGGFVPSQSELKIDILKRFNRETIVKDLEAQIDQSLVNCMNNLSSFPGVKFIDSAKNFSFDWNENDFSVNLDYPFSAVQGNQSHVYSKFSTRIPVKLNTILNNAEALAYSYSETNMIDLDILQGNLRVVFWPSNKDLVVSVFDESGVLNGKPYMFNLVFGMT